MPSVGGPGPIFVLLIVLIVFGAGRLPEVLGQLGKGVRSFRDEASNDAKPTPPSSADDTKRS